MFKKGHTYIHRNFIDCCVYVLNSYRLSDGRYILKIRWQLQRGMDLNLQETVKIERNQIKNWVEYEFEAS
jgi:hypothetical protein